MDGWYGSGMEGSREEENVVLRRVTALVDLVCVVLKGRALDYERADGGSSCSWMAPEELTMRVVCNAGWSKKHLIETVASKICFTQSWMCIVVELKSRELAGWMAYKKL